MQDLPRLDYSYEVITHVDSAYAIADLVTTGMNADGSEPRIEDLSTTTLRAAMFDIQQNFEAARKLRVRMSI
jgi:hypothetical protein